MRGRRSDDPAPTLDEGGDLLGTIGVVSICSTMMALGTVAMLFVNVPKQIEAATQNFSAGILVAAIAGELFPLLHGHGNVHAHKKWEKTLGMLFGFSLGLVLMFGQKHLLGHDGGGSHGDDDDMEEVIKLESCEEILLDAAPAAAAGRNSQSYCPSIFPI